MNIKHTDLLQDQAWLLLLAINKKETSLFTFPEVDFTYYCRLDSVNKRAYARWTRRCVTHLKALDNLHALNFPFYPGDFAQPSVLSSGVLGQGATL
ncbi:hypothetical protein [Methylobacter sp. S3L5C]|uniref:hypothetical protein n=1 Tax=Methylobacter sp. S3L5C TaxID=2839024 RepID=UPI001FAE1626|nr:hypothetical protein [Methylobacter sp. S3L5C]UOA07505.1 hypothetical protein KKZ03_14685 [Methylobacter sp. S3L5C]UOA07515.1 hypothetical protein KKZ03_14735 [Methylobacter sp. S3L5C]